VVYGQLPSSPSLLSRVCFALKVDVLNSLLPATAVAAFDLVMQK
jgi:hypothetical protein